MSESGHLHRSDEFEELMRRVDGITGLLRQNAARSEELRDLAPETVRALHDSGVFTVGIPRELGGYELSPRQVVEVVAALSYADASAGWTFAALQMITGTTTAYLGPEAAAELCADVRAGRHALIAGHGTKMGTARRVDGGYRISGHWHFASGISLASHVHSAALCEDTGRAMVVTFPLDRAELVDNWDVLGLRATGSIDYTCDGVFVPDSHVYDIATTEPRHGGALYRLGLANMAGIAHTGWALGVGRRLLDEMRSLAVRKSGSPGSSVDTAEFHADYARAEASLRSAHAWAKDVWASNESTMDRGELLGVEQETLTRLMLNHTTWSAQSVGQTVHRWAATALIRDGDLQRLFRDLHTGTQHITSSPVVLQHCGRWLSGLAPDANWVFLDLQDQS